jgi:hypothetical protein
MYSGLFWKDVFERLVSTVAQVLIALLSVDGLDLATFDLQAALTACGIAAALVVLKSLVAVNIKNPTVSPASLAPTE